MIPSKIIRSKRKTIALVIDSNGDLVVRAPNKTSEKTIALFVAQKADWIHKHQSLSRAKLSAFPAITGRSGEKLPYLGEQYTIQTSDISKVVLRDNLLLCPKEENTTASITRWLKVQAKEYINPRAEYFSKAMNLEYGKLRISSAKTRWGSCSGKNNLSFSFRLIHCPKVIIDYVIIHELCHILVKNHSKEFWAVVAPVVPNYKECRRWLRDNARLAGII